MRQTPAMSTIPPAIEPRQDFPRVIDPEWEAMRQRGKEPEMPEWVPEALDQLDQMVTEGTAHYVPWEEMKARLQQRYPNT